MENQLYKMRNCSLKNIISFVILFVSINSFAQQETLFTQYMYNMSIINPGYATSDVGTINLGGMYRTQWVGVGGAPDSGLLFAHTALSDKVEVGFNLLNDQRGDGVLADTKINVDFAYVLKVSEGTKLSLGLKGGMSLFSANVSSLSGSINNPYVSNESYVLPNVGVGGFLFGDKYYVGISSPNLLSTDKSKTVGAIATSTEVQSIHYYLTGGYVFDLSENLKYKPSLMLRAEPSVPLSIDINNNVLINNKLEVGLGYRHNADLMANVVFSITPKLRIGYAYDYALFNDLQDFSSGSHEIMLLWDLGGIKRSISYDKSPRFY